MPSFELLQRCDAVKEDEYDMRHRNPPINELGIIYPVTSIQDSHCTVLPRHLDLNVVCVLYGRLILVLYQEDWVSDDSSLRVLPIAYQFPKMKMLQEKSRFPDLFWPKQTDRTLWP